MFADKCFLLPEVGNRPQGHGNDAPTSGNQKELQMPFSIQKKAAEGNICANSLKTKSPPEGSEEEAERARISPSKTLSYQKQKQLSRRTGQLGYQR
jgi:hypothetical protein